MSGSFLSIGREDRCEISTMPGGKCSFNPLWLTKPEYKDWVREDTTSKHKAFCFACKKSIDLLAMGESALVSHSRGQKHLQRLKAGQPRVSLTDFFSKSASSSSMDLSKNLQNLQLVQAQFVQCKMTRFQLWFSQMQVSNRFALKTMCCRPKFYGLWKL